MYTVRNFLVVIGGLIVLIVLLSLISSPGQLTGPVEFTLKDGDSIYLEQDAEFSHVFSYGTFSFDNTREIISSIPVKSSPELSEHEEAQLFLRTTGSELKDFHHIPAGVFPEGDWLLDSNEKLYLTLNEGYKAQTWTDSEIRRWGWIISIIIYIYIVIVIQFLKY